MYSLYDDPLDIEPSWEVEIGVALLLILTVCLG